jgi:hypothetical protein
MGEMNSGMEQKNKPARFSPDRDMAYGMIAAQDCPMSAGLLPERCHLDLVSAQIAEGALGVAIFDGTALQPFRLRAVPPGGPPFE